MDSGQTIQSQWYVRRAGQTRGPLPYARLSRDILLGRVLATDELSADRRQWQPLSGLPELVPSVLRAGTTNTGRQQLLLARLRVDERIHERRHARQRPSVERRRLERRQTEWRELDRLAPQAAPSPSLAEDDSTILILTAVGMLLLFVAVIYLLW